MPARISADRGQRFRGASAVLFSLLAGAASSSAGSPAQARDSRGPGPPIRAAPPPGLDGDADTPTRKADLDRVLTSPLRRVRLIPPRLGELAVLGADRSPTFARLLFELQPLDVIVHVTRSPLPRGAARALTTLGSHTGRVRFIRIQLAEHLLGDDRIAVLGHELVHALEIATEPSVRSADGVQRLYRQIGFRGAGPGEHESDAAQRIEHRIRVELAGKRQ